MATRIAGLSEIAPDYPFILCDVWGVLHNGVAAWAGASDALVRFRQGGGRVALITNAPRPAGPVLKQLTGLGVDQAAFDAIVTSGDVTRGLIERTDGAVFHIGPERDHTLYHGLDVGFAGADEAAAVVCTGFFDDERDSPEDYHTLLQRLRARNLPFICANPDIVVERGHKLIWCAGALAREYLAMGGETRISGKPFAPIYDYAIGRLEEIEGQSIQRSKILAIGDGMPTDVKGARDNGIDLLYVSAGIHASRYGPPDAPDSSRLEAFLAEEGADPVAWQPRLMW